MRMMHVATLALILTTACSGDLSAPPIPQAWHHSALDAAPSAARVIIMGDSISEGLGASPRQRSYANLLLHNDDAHYPDDVGYDLSHLWNEPAYLNVAHAGDTTEELINEQLPRLRAALEDPAQLGPTPVHGRTVVALTIGGNDVRHQMGPKVNYTGAVLHAAAIRLRELFAFFADTQRFPDGVAIYLANIYDVTDGTGSAHLCMPGLVFPSLDDALLEWDRCYTNLAAASRTPTLQVHRVDIMRLFYGHAFHYADPDNPHFQQDDPSLWLSDFDCIHPNNRGHHELRRAFYGAISGVTPP